jgi:hypothetical protein
MEGVQMNDTIILDRKKCNAELLTIHADGRITVSEDCKPTETAAEVLRIMRDQWLADIQCAKIRELQERIKRLEEAGDRMASTHLEKPSYESALYDVCAWDKAKEVKP